MDRLSEGSRMSNESRNLATSLFKGLDLLGVLSVRSEEGAGITELVDDMGLPRTSVLRMLDSLIHYGLVGRDSERRYRVTDKFREWRMEDEQERLIAEHRPLLRRIADEVGEMAALGRLQGRRIRHLHWEEPDCRVRVMPPGGRSFEIERMAMGKLALSQRPDLVPAKSSPVTLAEIEEAGRLGYAWNRGESEEGIVAWGTWLGEPSPLALMLAITWPEFRYSDAALGKAKSILKEWRSA